MKTVRSYSEALKRREPYISDPYESATGRLLVAISHPIFDPQGQYKGYVSGTIYLREGTGSAGQDDLF